MRPLARRGHQKALGKHHPQDGREYRESSLVGRGTEIVTYPADGLRVGCSICYDLRFPELYRALVDQGAELVAVPAAFTVSTGEAHWHVLLRARAIETGCHILAAAQAGTHADGRATYAHSVIIDPWGTVIAEAAATNHAGDMGYDLLLAAVDAGALTRARQAIPLARSRSVRAIKL